MNQPKKSKTVNIVIAVVVALIVFGVIGAVTQDTTNQPTKDGNTVKTEQSDKDNQKDSKKVATPKYEIVKDVPTKNAVGSGTWETYYIYVSEVVDQNTDDGNAKLNAIIDNLKAKNDANYSSDGYRFKAHLYSDKELATWESDPAQQAQNYDAMTAKLADHNLAFYDGITDPDKAKIQYFNGVDYTEETFDTDK